MNCLKCGRNIPDNIRYCPYCGSVQEETEIVLEENVPHSEEISDTSVKDDSIIDIEKDSEHVLLTGNNESDADSSDNNSEIDKDDISDDHQGNRIEDSVERQYSIGIKVVYSILILLVVIAIALTVTRYTSKSSLQLNEVRNSCTNDISGIIFQMQNKFGNDVMNSAKVYELCMGSYGYIIQMAGEDADKFAFLLPRAEASLKEKTMDASGLYERSMHAGVLYLMEGMNITEPVEPETNERVVINKQSLTLSKVTLKEYPEIYDGYSSVAYLITDSFHRIRRVMILTSDGFLVRSDYTYDDNNRIIKAHWTSVWMDKEQWEMLGWYSVEEDRMQIAVSEIDKYIKNAIVALPKDFVKASPSGKNYDSNEIYVYDDNGYVIEVDDINGSKHVVWKFTYDHGLRLDAIREWRDDSLKEEMQNYFIYERDKDGFVIGLEPDEGFVRLNGISDVTWDVIKSFKYTYADDGTMRLEIEEAD